MSSNDYRLIEDHLSIQATNAEILRENKIRKNQEPQDHV